MLFHSCFYVDCITDYADNEEVHVQTPSRCHGDTHASTLSMQQRVTRGARAGDVHDSRHERHDDQGPRERVAGTLQKVHDHHGFHER